MSLLDFMNTDEARMGLGLLAAAGPRSDGAGFGQRMMEGIGYADHYKQGQQKSKYLQMQMDEAQAKMEQEKAAREMLMRKQAALPGLFTGGRAGLAPLVGDAETGILPSMGRASTPASLDVQKALMAGYTPDEIGKLDGLRNIGRNEVARTMKGMVNGREVDQQYDKFGGAVGSGMEQYKAPIEMSTGASKMLLDPFTRQPISSFKMEQSPESRASTALGWANNAATLRGQDMTDSRTRDANDIKRGETNSVKDQAKAGQVASFDTMLGTLGRLSKHPGLSRSVGFTGAFPTMPGSESANFKAELDTFQSQAFLPMVSQLKGMGALSDAEGKKITAAVGALNPNMGETAFRESVTRITSDMNAARNRLTGASAGGSGATGDFSGSSTPSKPPVPMKGMVQNGAGFWCGSANTFIREAA